MADGADRQHVPPPEHVRTIDILEGTADAVVMSRDGTFVAAGGHGGVIRVWDGRTGLERRTIGERQGPIRVLTLSADGRRIASCSHARLEMSTEGLSVTGRFHGTVLKVWDTATGTLFGEHATDDTILRAGFGTPDGRRLVFVDEGELLDWEVANGRVRAVEAREIAAEARSVSVRILMGCSDDGHRIVAFAAKPVPRGGHTAMLCVWDDVQEMEANRIHVLEYSSLGKSLVSSAIDLQARFAVFAHMPDLPPGQPGARHRLYTILNLVTGAVATRLQTRPEFTPYVHFLGFSPDSTRVVTGTSQGPFHGLTPQARATAQRARAASGTSQGAFDEREFALWLWDARDGRLIQSFRSPGGEIRAVSFLRDGRLRVVSKQSRPVLDERGNLKPEESLKIWEAGPA